MSITHHDSLSAELREVEKVHPHWHAFISDEGRVYAVTNHGLPNHGITVHALTPDGLDHEIAVYEYEHPRGWAA